MKVKFTVTDQQKDPVKSQNIVHPSILDNNPKYSLFEAYKKERMVCGSWYTPRNPSFKGLTCRRHCFSRILACKNTHLTVFIAAMKGEHDAILAWPFKKKVTLRLTDQQEHLVELQNVFGKIDPDNRPDNFVRPIHHEKNPG